MTITMREVMWGDALRLESLKCHGPRGFAGLTDRLRDYFGDTIGSRNTFTKLFGVSDPTALSPRDGWRAWVVLVALGLEPNDWGIGDAVVPAVYRATKLRALLPHLDSNQKPADYRHPTHEARFRLGAAA